MPTNLITDLLASRFDMRVVDADVVALTADVARVRFRDGEGILPASEWYADRPMPGVGERLQLVQLTDSPLAVCSATSPELAKLLLEAVTPEARCGDVRVMGVARAAGRRTKIAVAATVADLDPIAACVGKGANRVRYVSEVLGGERIDVVAWHPDTAVYVSNALAPASVESVEVIDGVARVVVASHQMATALGSGGHNSALAARLAGVPVSVAVA
jgi:transcription termination/antitermination protein NusA